MKIAFIGGGSVQWTPTLVTDMALTDTLANAHLALHDIDAAALDLSTRVCQRISEQAGDSLRVGSTTDRAEALRDADFVILCVSIGGLAAMRNDLEIPGRYGVYQSVGDTVGSGGLAHPAFAVIAPHVARQELIVEAALATDPLVRDPATVAPMLDELLAANAAYLL